MVEAGLRNDQSCDDEEGKNENSDATSEQAKREHCYSFEHMPEANEDLRMKAPYCCNCLCLVGI